jgi:hypothetical protein
MKKWSFYTVTPVPANTYQGVTSDVKTVSVKSMLAVSSKLPSALVYDLLKALYSNTDRLVAAHKKGADIKIDTAKAGMSIPLHPGAEKFFKDMGK